MCSKKAFCASAREGQRSPSSTFNVAKKLSTKALSQPWPFRLIMTASPCARSTLWQPALVFWRPRVGLMDQLRANVPFGQRPLEYRVCRRLG